MKKFVFVAVIAALFAVGCSAPATAADFSYVGAKYTSQGTPFSAGGYVLEGSVDVTDKVFVQAAFLDGFDRDNSAGTVKLGVGAHTMIAQNADLYGTFSTLALVDDRRGADKFNYEVEAGVKTDLNTDWQLTTAVVAGNLRDRRFDNVVYLGKVGVERKLTDNLSATLDVLGKSHYREGQIGVRYYF